LAEQEFVSAPVDPSPDAAEHCALQVEKLLESKASEIAAVILEPIVQGAGGMRFFHPLLLQRLRDVCDKNDVFFEIKYPLNNL
jgi:adenosylmethionine-8-amino-7-oxononanoate aminotransferase